MAQLKT